MKKYRKKILLCCLLAALSPFSSQAQDMAGEIGGLNGVLDSLYTEMMPLCSQLIGVARGLAGFAALFYIAARVWRHLSNAEPIDFYPLFRPFAIGFCITVFPSVLGLINGVMKPTVSGTAAMVQGSNVAVESLLALKEEKIKETSKWKMYVGGSGEGDKEKWYKYTYDEDISEEGLFDGIGNDIRFAMEKAGYNFRNSIKEWMSEVLQVLFQAAALCINTLRTFQLVILSILGPLVFGLAVFDGFQHTLTIWLARYINVFLWLPVANIFGAIIGKIQEKMLQLDLSQIQEAGDTFFSTADTGYLIFMIIGIVGYFTVPSVANYIVHAAGGGALQQKTTSMFSTVTSGATGMGGSAAAKGLSYARQGAGMAADSMGDAAGRMSQSMSSSAATSAYFNDKLSGKP